MHAVLWGVWMCSLEETFSLSLSLSRSLARSLALKSSPKLLEVYQHLCLAAPFGSPMETSPSNLKLHLQPRKAGTTAPKQKAIT